MHPAYARRLALAKERGTCVTCNAPPDNGTLRCNECAAKQAWNHQIRKGTRIKDGLCGICGEKNETVGYSCQSCRLQRSNRLGTYYEQPKQRLSRLVTAALWRAKDRGIPHDEDLRKIVDDPPATCRVCSVNIDYTKKRKSSNDKVNSPSLDRVNPNGGYTFANVRVICFRCNILKRDSTKQDLRNLLRYVEECDQ